MRILQIHNQYQQTGGEDAVVAGERVLLATHGDDVRTLTVFNSDVRGLWSKIRTAWQAPYSLVSRRRVMDELAKYRPDVVHVHNFFPLLTPSIYDACKQHNVPVVQTLHNYRTICPGALLMRSGRVCEDCVVGSAFQSVLHGCYRGSRLGTLAVARMVEFHRKHGTWQQKVDRFIALTQFAHDKFVQAGFPKNKIRIKPNFYAGEFLCDSGSKRTGALYVGRLSEEKGIETLLQAWNGLDIPLTLIGEGPMLNSLQSAGHKNVTILGRRNNSEVRSAMQRASYLVVPSEWYEGFPMVLVEAFANALPVIASSIGALKELVEDRETGLHFSPRDAGDLASKVRWAASHPMDMLRMGISAQEICRKNYTPEVNYQALMKVYGEVLGG